MNDSKTTPQTEAQLLPLAEAGDMNAALELAKLYLETRNPALYRWAKTLCAGGKPEGYYLLGIFSYYIVRDKEWAYKALSHAAANGSQEAMTALHNLFGAN